MANAETLAASLKRIMGGLRVEGDPLPDLYRCERCNDSGVVEVDPDAPRTAWRRCPVCMERRRVEGAAGEERFG